MAYDAALHDFDPVTGFMVHKGTVSPVGVIQYVPPSPLHDDYPKWVVAHGSHVVGDLAPELGESFRPRNGEVMVIVHDEDEERVALAEKASVKPPISDVPHNEPTPLGVIHDEHKKDIEHHEETERGVPGFESF